VLETAVVYPHIPRLEMDAAKARIAELVQTHRLAVVAIGDGTGFQETEKLISELIATSCPELRYAVVAQKPAQTYAGDSLAEKELPGLDRPLRTAVSVGRQLLDPLTELTKVNLRDLCSVRYLQELDGSTVERAIRRVAEECAAAVGPDLNTAPRTLLKYVPGLDAVTASEVVKWRTHKGPLASRHQLREVPKVNEDIWRQAVGFVKVQGSENPLDCTRIHPDYYPVAAAILEQLGVDGQDLSGPEVRAEIAKRRGEVKVGELEKRFDVHYLYVKDILDELVEPWADPRLKEQGPLLRRRQLGLADLEPGQTLYGTVRKVVDFGAFVDIGVSEDGLVHISELADDFVQTPYDVVSVGDMVKVRVVEVNPERHRIALSMRSESAPRKTPRPQRETDRSARPSVRRRPAATPAPRGRARGGVQAPQSTLGAESRRVKKVAVFQRKPGAEGGEREPATQRTRPQREEETKQEQQRQQKAPLDDLLRKLDIAAIERRGEQRQ